ncbi:MAG: (d)CMP kinase [Actinomycetales bacterium]|nr:(d)CMP kinase [Actinomycetales bacterium]
MSELSPEARLSELRAMCPQIAIDGPSGSGKSTVARALAGLLHGDYVDTGATYRAMTWWMLQCGVDVDQPDDVAARVNEPIIELGVDPQSPAVWVDARDVSTDVRTAAVSAAVSKVAAVPAVRVRMVDLQRAYAENARNHGRAVVMEGRDIAEVVLPGADAKVWLTADLQARAARRAAQDEQLLGAQAAVADVAQGLQQRDTADSSRAATPVTIAADAVVVDATHLSVEQTVHAVLDAAAKQAGVADA